MKPVCCIVRLLPNEHLGCRKSLVAALDVPNLACYAVIAAPDHLPALTDIVMDSRYFSRQNCTCVGLPGTTYTLKVHSNGTGTCEVVVQTPPLLRGLPYSVIIATTISSFLVLVVLLLLAFLWFRLRRERSIKAGGPPGRASGTCAAECWCCTCKSCVQCCVTVRATISQARQPDLLCASHGQMHGSASSLHMPQTLVLMGAVLCSDQGAAAGHGLHRRGEQHRAVGVEQRHHDGELGHP